jgi:hypothetical protein
MSASIICSSTARKPATASGPALRKAVRMRARCASESWRSSSDACVGQVKVAFALVPRPHAAVDEAVLDEGPEDAVQGLLRDAQDRQEVVHRCPGGTVDEVDRPVMRASVAVFLKDAVGIGGKPAIGEEHRLDPAPQLFVGQEKKTFTSSQ